MEPAGQKHVADLAAKEGHRFRGLHREAHHRTGGAVDPARQVNRTDAGCRVHGLDHGARNAFDRSIQTGAEQRVDDDVGRHQRRRCSRSRRTLPALRRQRRIPLEPLEVPDHKDAHPVSALGQNAGGDKTVAPVVARPRNHGHA